MAKETNGKVKVMDLTCIQQKRKLKGIDNAAIASNGPAPIMLQRIIAASNVGNILILLASFSFYSIDVKVINEQKC